MSASLRLFSYRRSFGSVIEHVHSFFCIFLSISDSFSLGWLLLFFFFKLSSSYHRKNAWFFFVLLCDQIDWLVRSPDTISRHNNDKIKQFFRNIIAEYQLSRHRLDVKEFHPEKFLLLELESRIMDFIIIIMEWMYILIYLYNDIFLKKFIIFNLNRLTTIGLFECDVWLGLSLMS